MFRHQVLPFHVCPFTLPLLPPLTLSALPLQSPLALFLPTHGPATAGPHPLASPLLIESLYRLTFPLRWVSPPTAGVSASLLISRCLRVSECGSL